MQQQAGRMGKEEASSHVARKKEAAERIERFHQRQKEIDKSAMEHEAREAGKRGTRPISPSNEKSGNKCGNFFGLS